ncbi:MAG: glycosyltransferase family 2 protein [Candidatus Hodarchaeales archaeon]
MIKKEIMVILPAYNEELSLTTLIDQLDKYCSREQILVADDGSIDNTLSIAEHSGVKTVTCRSNQGKGFILRKAFMTVISQMPRVKWIFTLDADGQHSTEDIPKFISAIKENPEVGIINGERQYWQMPLVNRISNTLTSNWCNFWLKWNIHDLQCGFRLYNVEHLREIINYGLISRKFELETEVLFIAWLKGIKISQIPITTVYEKQRRRSRVKPALDTFRWIFLGMKFGFKYQFFHKIWMTRKIQD